MQRYLVNIEKKVTTTYAVLADSDAAATDLAVESEVTASSFGPNRDAGRIVDLDRSIRPEVVRDAEQAELFAKHAHVVRGTNMALKAL